MHRARVALLVGVVSTVACVAAMACTDVSTDPDTVVAVRFDGSAYPSIVVGDSLRDSLGALQPVRATGLNYKGDIVEGADFVFSSPDTNLRLNNDGMVFARSRKTDGSPARIFATVGSLQSQPDSLLIVVRADSMKAARGVDTIPLTPSGGVTPDTLRYQVFGDTLLNTPKIAVPGWLVSFQLKYRGALLVPTDTSVAYTYMPSTGATPRRVPKFIDTTDASGFAEIRAFVRSISATAAEDTIFLIATARSRKVGVGPITAQTTIVVRRQ